MNSILAIEQFHLVEYKQILWEQLIQKHELDEETVQLQKTLASFGETDLLLYMQEYWDMSEREYSDVLVRYNLDVFPLLISRIEDIQDERFLRAVLRRVSEGNEDEYFFFVCSYLDYENTETRLCALQSLKHLQSYISSVNLTPFLESDLFQERMTAAQLCGISRQNKYKDYLYRLMGDENWWVRYRTAEAIGLYEDGDIMLRYISENHLDRYAQQMAGQWIGSVS